MDGWGCGVGGMGEGDLRPPSHVMCKSYMSCSRLEAHRQHLLLGFSS